MSDHIRVQVRDEVHRLGDRVHQPSLADWLRRCSVGLVATLLVGLFTLAEHQPALAGLINRVAGVRQTDRLALIVLRTPMSLFASAPNLPVWGALAQVLVVVALAQMVLGPTRTIAIAIEAQFLVNLVAHALLVDGHRSWLGIGQVPGLDTGPSVAVVALAFAVALELRAAWLGSVLVVGLLTELVFHPDLAGHEHIIGLVSGALLWWLHRAGSAGRQPLGVPAIGPNIGQRRRRNVRRAASASIASLGVLAIVSALAFPRGHHRHHSALFSIGTEHFANGVVAALGVALVVLSRGLLRGQRRAWLLASTMLGLVAAAHLVKGGDAVAAAVSLSGLVLLIAAHRSFLAKTDSRSTIVAVGAASAALVVAFIAATFCVEALTANAGRRRLAVGAAAKLVSETLVGGHHLPMTSRSAGFLHAGEFGVAAAVGLLGLWRVLRPVLVSRPSDEQRKHDRSIGRVMLDRHGGGTLDYFILRDDKVLFFTGQTMIGYTVRFGVCIVSPDPIGPVEERHAAWAAFRTFADRQGWTVAVLAASEEWLEIYRSYGMLTVYAGDEGVVDTAAFGLEGGERKSLRQAVNRVARHGYTMSFHDPAAIDGELRQALETLLTSSRKGGVERGFSMTLGRFLDPADSGLLLAVCHGPDGSPAAFCQFVPSRAINGWSLDLMRRELGVHPNGLLDFVLVETIRHVAATGGGGLGLNFATMRAVLAAEGRLGPVSRVQRWVLQRLSGDMQIASLWHFNAKYGPQWVPRYVALDGAENVLHVATAIASAESLWELPVIGRWLTRDRRPRRPAVA